ncbi:MAG: hypothetical protein ABW220_04095, partial [Burkholderiaceae bacterium]
MRQQSLLCVAASLGDAHREPIGGGRATASLVGSCQTFARVRKAMGRCRDLRFDERRASGVRVDAQQLRRQLIESVEGIEIAEKLGVQLLLLDEPFGDTAAQGRPPEAAPGLRQRAAQVVGRNDAVGGLHGTGLEFGLGDHGRTPKRALRLSRPVFSSVELMVFTMRSGWPPGM